MLLTLLTAQPAQAHGYIVRSIPGDRAVLERSPTRVQYWFSESLEREFSSITVRDQTGAVIATGGVADDNATLLRVQLAPNLPDGAYIVDLRPAFASDGHVYPESRVFFVGQEVGGVSGQGVSDRAIPLEAAWRALTLVALLLAFGACTTYAAVLLPAWGSPEHRAGLLPPRVMTRLTTLVGVALLLALLGSVLALIQQTMAFFAVDFMRALDPSLWNVVRIGSRFGDVWTFRMFLLMLALVVVLASAYYRRDQPALVRPFWSANAWALALALGTFSAISHAAGSLLWPWVGVALDWLHMTAVGFWVGGVMTLALVLPVALRPYTGEARRLALLAALRRFSRLALVSALLVITTGVYSAGNWLTAPDELTTTSFGGTLIFKVLMVAGLLAIGALNHIALHPARYARFTALTARFGDFDQRLRVEAVVAALVVGMAGLLTATPIPVPAFTTEQPPAPTSAQQVDDVEVALTLSPGGPGVNTYDVVVMHEGQPLDDLAVWVRHLAPDRDLRSAWLPADGVGNGVYVGSDGDIDRPGAWWTLVDVEVHAGEWLRAAFVWDITQDAAVLEARDPSLLNIAALAAVVLTLGWASYPPLTRLARRLDLNPVTVTLAAGALIATVIFMAAGYVLVAESDRQYQEALRPPPEIVNPMLPDASSLRIGAQTYAEACATWPEAATGLAELRESLPRTTDAELFAFTRDGWRALPPCADDLSEAARWHLVNYLRTFERR